MTLAIELCYVLSEPTNNIPEEEEIKGLHGVLLSLGPPADDVLPLMGQRQEQ